jgi:hypothetical protein
VAEARQDSISKMPKQGDSMRSREQCAGAFSLLTMNPIKQDKRKGAGASANLPLLKAQWATKCAQPAA